MKAVVFRGPGRLAAEEWPRPAIGGGELLVRLRGCGLCGSDLTKISARRRQRRRCSGHELVGDVVEVGAGVNAFAVGDRVVAAHHVPCGDCHYCRRGSASMCRAFKASRLDPGGFADYVRVPGSNVAYATFRIPAHVSDEAASFIEPLGCCLRALRRAGLVVGDTTVVVGLGSIGHLFVQLFRRVGAGVVAVDADKARIELAEQQGVPALAPAQAETAIEKLSDGRGADLVMITGGGGRALEWAVKVVRDGGGIHYFAGGPGDSLPLALETLYHRELTLTATYSSSPADLAEAHRLITQGKILVQGLYTHRVPLERLDEGVALMQSRSALKVYVTP